MILGYIDRDGRAYDLGFATLKMRIRVEPRGPKGESVVHFTSPSGAVATHRVLGEADGAVDVAMDHGGDRVPLLRPVEGHFYRHETGLVFFGAPTSRDPDDPTFFLVKLRALPTAVRFFFEDQEGTEMLSIPSEEVLGVDPSADTITLTLSAANVALPKEKLAYAVTLRPAARIAPLLEGLPLSAGR